MSATPDSGADSPYRRDNFFGDEDDPDDELGGHVEIHGTDAAEYLMFQELVELTEPLCARTLRKSGTEQPLSDPTMYLPKETERFGRTIEYGQHRHRRRINPETGWINWGETTSTDVPEVDEETYLQAVHNYLWKNGVSVTNVNAWIRYSKRLFYDQQLSSKDALAKFIRKKRAYDNPDNLDVTTVPE